MEPQADEEKATAQSQPTVNIETDVKHLQHQSETRQHDTIGLEMRQYKTQHDMSRRRQQSLSASNHLVAIGHVLRALLLERKEAGHGRDALRQVALRRHLPNDLLLSHRGQEELTDDDTTPTTPDATPPNPETVLETLSTCCASEEEEEEEEEEEDRRGS